MKKNLILSLILMTSLMFMVISVSAVTVDGIISSGEWDDATEIDVASGMGTVSVMADTDYLYVLFDLNDLNDARTLYVNEVGNDQISININPTHGGAWGFPYDLIFETSALSAADGGHHVLPWNPKVNSGTSSDGWATRWFPNDAQDNLPSELESDTTYGGGKRISEWKLPLSSINLIGDDQLKIGGAVDVGDGNSYVYPINLNWNDALTFVKIDWDNKDPEVTLYPTYSGLEGDKPDNKVKIEASSTTDEGTGIKVYHWEFSDGTTKDTSKPRVKYSFPDGDKTYTVKVTAEDYAGNTGSDTASVIIENVAPIVTNINTQNIGAVGEAIQFSAVGVNDVKADNDTLIYNWDFDGVGSVTNGNTANPRFTYSSESSHTVTLTVEDKDGGISNIVSTVIEIVQPTSLDDQEVIAFHKLNATFSDTGKNRFKHGITNGICVNITSRVEITDNGKNTKCIVKWQNPRPTNDEQGEYLVVVKVSNSTDYEYYSFTVTVYSWMIHLQEGWNLVSIPLVHETGNMGDVLDSSIRDKIERIWSYEYNLETGKSEWSCVKPTSSSGSKCATEIPKLTKIETGRGYWIKVKDGEEVTIKGFGQKTSAMPAMIPAIEAPLNSWALLGRYGIVGTTLGQFGSLNKGVALKSLPQIGGRVVYEFDNVLSSISLTSILNPQQGYLVFVSNPTLTNALYTPINPEYSDN